jgi:hypothetical protein
VALPVDTKATEDVSFEEIFRGGIVAQAKAATRGE